MNIFSVPATLITSCTTTINTTAPAGITMTTISSTAHNRNIMSIFCVLVYAMRVVDIY